MCLEDVVTLTVSDDLVARGRHEVAQFLRRAFTDPHDLVGDAQLIVSELVTNALRLGAPEVQLRLLAHVGDLRVGVHDAMPGRPDLQEAVAGPTDVAGRGLAVVEQVAQSWGVEDDATGKTVWGSLPVAAAAGPRFNCRFAPDDVIQPEEGASASS